MKRFKVLMEWDPTDRVWITYVPSLGHLSTCGATREAAMNATREAIAGYFEAAAKEGIGAGGPATGTCAEAGSGLAHEPGAAREEGVPDRLEGGCEGVDGLLEKTFEFVRRRIKVVVEFQEILLERRGSLSPDPEDGGPLAERIASGKRRFSARSGPEAGSRR